MNTNIRRYVQRGRSTIYNTIIRILREPRKKHIRTFSGFSLLPVGVIFVFYAFFQNTPNLLSHQEYSLDIDFLPIEPTLLGSVGREDFIEAYEVFNQNPVGQDELEAAADVFYFENRLRKMVHGYPIEVMASSIVKQERIVAALLVGIAKKESDWGKHAPSKSGRDCYNYWGYKGSGSAGSSMGYACFSSPEEAVEVVGKRIHDLSIKAKKNTPAKMIVWKCGNTCQGHSQESVRSWIHDVETYYTKLIALR